MVPKVRYLRVFEILEAQRRAVHNKMKEYSTSHIVYPGLSFWRDGHKTKIDPMEVKGIRE